MATSPFEASLLLLGVIGTSSFSCSSLHITSTPEEDSFRNTMPCTFVKDTKEADTTLHTIGKGFCGTVWAASEGGCALKREDGGPDRSLRNDFEMHNRIIQSFQKLAYSDESPKINLRIQIPDCYEFIRATDQKWWSTNQRRFPPGYTPCNIIQSERIPPFSEAIRQVLISNYCPSKITQ